MFTSPGKIILIVLLFCFSLMKAQDTLTVELGSDYLKDAYINIVNHEPHGSNQGLVASVWTHSGEYGTGRSLIGFDFSGLRVNSRVIEARLNLFHDPISGHQGHSTLGGDNTGIIFRITEPWNEDSVTWYSQPATTNTNAILIPAPATDTSDFLDVDITPIIKDMIRHPESSDGFMIKLFSEDTLYRSLVFASSDHPYAELHPSIEITYVTNLPLDSTLHILPADDATVFSQSSSLAKTTDQSLVSMVWEGNEGWSLGRSFVNFDLSEINPNHSITYAELNLYHDPTSTTIGHINNGRSNELLISRIIENWDDTNLNWENQPLITDQNQVVVPGSNIQNQDYLDINVTTLIEDMINNPDASFGFNISLFDEVTFDYNRNVVFASSNHEMMELRPKLVVYTQDYTNIDEFDEFDSKVKVYPNPGIGEFNISITNDLIGCKGVILDGYGNIVSIRKFSSEYNIIYLSNYPSGLYHLIISYDKGTIAKKIVVL
jgi:type IX secretion system substrate protein/TGF-beta propeptide